MKTTGTKITMVMFLAMGLAAGCATQTEPEPEPAPPADAEPDALRAAFDEIDPDAMTPREALDALYELKKLD